MSPALSQLPVDIDCTSNLYFIIGLPLSFGADQESVMLLRSILSLYGDTCGFSFSTTASGLPAASASGTINGIDGGTNSMLTRKIPKNTVIIFFRVIVYLMEQTNKSDRSKQEFYLLN